MKIIPCTLAVITLGLTGCAIPIKDGKAEDINKVSILNLTSRELKIPESDIEIFDLAHKKRIWVYSTVENFVWKAKTPQGIYDCATDEGYQMRNSFGNGSGCVKISQ